MGTVVYIICDREPDNFEVCRVLPDGKKVAKSYNGEGMSNEEMIDHLKTHYPELFKTDI